MVKRLFNVSNRVNIPEPGQAVAGGLDNTLTSCKGFDEIVRFGYSGTAIPDSEYDFDNPEKYVHNTKRQLDDGRTIIYYTMDLPAGLYKNFYEKCANGDLWPAQHDRPDLVFGDNQSREDFIRMNALYFKGVRSVLQDQDELIIHDYHFMPFARIAREHGMKRALGLYIHIPALSRDVLESKDLNEDTRTFLSTLFQEDVFYYDLIGFQAPRDVANFQDVAGAEVTDMVEPYNTTWVERPDGRKVLAGVFPATGDLDEIRTKLKKEMARDDSELFLTMATDNRWEKRKDNNFKIMVGADRIDYSKALPKRVRAVRKLIEGGKLNPGEFQLIQAAAQSREGIEAYAQEIDEYRREYLSLREEFGPVVYSPWNATGKFVTLAQPKILRAYRDAAVGVFTSDMDGMHLGPKEFTAVANPENPGVCLMTNTVGAAHEFGDCAVIVDPTEDSIAEGMLRAMNMPLSERKDQNDKRLRILQENNNERWITSIVSATREGLNGRSAPSRDI